jgi:mannitol-1-phosphate/altronate dehydrogenase
MSFTKTTVITFASKEDSDAVIASKHTSIDRIVTEDTLKSADMIGDQLVVKRNWTTESLANNWIEYINSIAKKAGVTLVSAEVVDYTA